MASRLGGKEGVLSHTMTLGTLPRAPRHMRHLRHITYVTDVRRRIISAVTHSITFGTRRWQRRGLRILRFCFRVGHMLPHVPHCSLSISLLYLHRIIFLGCNSNNYNTWSGHMEAVLRHSGGSFLAHLSRDLRLSQSDPPPMESQTTLKSQGVQTECSYMNRYCRAA
jgi:hypothetical protein